MRRSTSRGRRPVSLSSMLEPGTAAPEFTLADQSGTPVSLGDFRGHWVVLWWYPKASTPG
jgi:thioredoxin-dependent peroxiredoxin